MDIGIGLFTGQRRPDDDRSMEAIYDEMLTLGRAVEDAELDSAWVSEHHFADDGYLPGVMPSLGALAAATDEVEIGPCIALAPFYDSVRFAEDAATVDLLSGGRLTVGLGIGYRDREFEGFGVPKGERTDRTEDLIEVLRGAWSPGPLGFDPRFHDAGPDFDVTPKPESPPPIVLGGSAKPAVRRAARLGDGWVAPSALSIEDIDRRMEDIERVRREEGIDGEFTTYVLQYGFIDDSREAAWERIRDSYFHVQRGYVEYATGEPVDELDPETRSGLKERPILGTPEQVAEGIEEYRSALGDDVHFIFRAYHPGIGTDAMAECIERLGDEVAPQFA